MAHRTLEQETSVSDTNNVQKGAAGVHPVVAKIAIAAAVWFLVVIWLSFASNGEIDYLLAIVTLFFAIFFTLFLFTASYSMHDPRWPARDTSFREFLDSSTPDEITSPESRRL